MRFAVVGDMHYCHSDESETCRQRDQLFERLFEQMKASGVEHVFSVGDIVHRGTTDEYDGLEKLAQSAGLPLTFAFGNHDLITLSAAEVARRFGRSPHLFVDRDRFRFIILNTSKDVSPRDWGGIMDDFQLHWLTEEALATLGDCIPVVIAHHPLPDTTTDSTGKMMAVENAGSLWRSLSAIQDRPGFYFCGHTHVHSIVERANWRMIQTGSLAQLLSYRLIESTADSVEVRTITIADQALIDLAASVDGAIQGMHRPGHRAGEPADSASLRLPYPPPSTPVEGAGI